MDCATFEEERLFNPPRKDRPIIDWLLMGTKEERFIDNILVELCERLCNAGVPVRRASVYFHMNYPQWLNARILWQLGLAAADIRTFEYGTEKTETYLQSPEHALAGGAPEVRQNLSSVDGFDRYPVFAELREEGLTDYVAWPLEHTLGKRHAICFATDAARGFSVHDLTTLKELIPVFALLSEVWLKNALSRTLLRTYVGERAGEQIRLLGFECGIGLSQNLATS